MTRHGMHEVRGAACWLGLGLMLLVGLSIGLRTAQAAPPKVAPELAQTPSTPSLAATDSSAPLARQGGDTCAEAILIPALPYWDSGTTLGYADDYDEMCPYGGSGPDVVYYYVSDSDTVIAIDLCESSYDTKVYVYEDICPDWGAPIACNDDACSDSQGNPYRSRLDNVVLLAGHTYYIVVDGYSSASFGDYELSLGCIPPCGLECPPGSTPEGEPDCYDDYEDVTNSGCGGAPPVYTPITCGETVCGAGGNYLYDGTLYRDTDWLEVEVTEPTTLTWEVMAEFPVMAGIVEPGPAGDCVDMQLVATDQADPCEYALVTYQVAPGIHWLWVGASVFEGVPCGSTWFGTLTCTPIGEPVGACCMGPSDCVELTDAACTDGGGLWLGDGTDCDPNPCLPGPGETCADALPVSTLPFYATGNTCDYLDNYDEVCPYTGSIAPDVVYVYSPLSTHLIAVDLCESAFDTKVFIYEDACPMAGEPLACNDDACSDSQGNPYRSQLFAIEVQAGHDYYIVVDGYGDTCGAYDLEIYEILGEDLDCPAGGIPEGEPDCGDNYSDQYNGGCGSDPVVFQPISCGQTICGIGGTFLYDGMNYRDTDWYVLELDEQAELSWSAVAEFPVLLFVIDAGSGDCVDYEILGSTEGLPWEWVDVSLTVPAGTYWLWIGADVFEGYPCDGGMAEYNAVVDCTPVGLICPPGGTPEGEPDCGDDYVDNYNGGCGSHPIAFQPIECGQTICGVGGTFLVQGFATRDTDWFEVVLDEEAELSWSAMAEFPVQVLLIDAGSGDCTDYQILDFADGLANERVDVTACLPAGTYWLWIGANVFEGYPCDAEASDYIAYATCMPCGVTCPPNVFFESVTPPDGAVDARQPNPVDSLTPRQGIGDPTQPIVVDMGTPGIDGECFALCETASYPEGANDIANVIDHGDGTYTIELERAITAGAVTTIEYLGNSSYIAYTAHPGNVNGNGQVNATDITALVDYLNGVSSPPWGSMSVDVDHSGVNGTPDITRLVDLLNGAGVYDVWLHTQRPEHGDCP